MTEADYFKIVIKLLAVFGTVLSTLYYYLQKSVIHKTWFSPVIELITILLISSFFIIVYGLINGMIRKDFTKEIDLDKYANDFYVLVFLMGILYSLSPIMDLISVIRQESIPHKDFIRLIITIFIILMFWIFYKNENFININKFIILFVTLVVLFFIAFSMLNPPISVLFQGHININMDNIYYTKSSPIPVSIEITGVNDELSINLRKSYLNKIIQIDNITLGPNLKDENIFGNNLIGNGFYSGIYYIFINTTNMTEGYYELVCSRSIDKFPYGKSFYLVNNGRN